MFNYFKTVFSRGVFAVALGALIFATSCNDDDSGEGGLFANFSSKVDANDFFTYQFTDLSDGAESWAWDFDDNGATSTDQNPSHTFSAAGTYTVSLTVTAGTDTDVFSADVTVTDPDVALTLLAGSTSKTWKLLREGTAMLLAADENYSQIYWAGSSNNGERPCLYDDTFTFERDGGYVYDDADTYWAEFGIFNGDTGCDAGSNTIAESCFDSSGGSIINECGDDVSAWLDGEHSFSYDVSAGTITLTGVGAWIGIPKLATTGAVIKPEASVTFDAVLRDGGTTGVDTLYASFNYNGAFWPITYVSYSDPSLEPDLVALNAKFSFEADKRTVAFTDESTGGATSWSWDFGDNSGTSTEQNPSYTYAEDGTYTVKLTVSDGSSSAESTASITVTNAKPEPSTLGHSFAAAGGADFLTLIGGASTITLGAADPAGGGGLVGEFTRVAGTQYQEAILTTDPQADFLLKNVTRMTIDVYFPSSNTYVGDNETATLAKNLVIGFSSAVSDVNGEWWTRQGQWSATPAALDTWETFTFDLTAPTEGNNTADATQRTDLDMLFLGIGGGNHFDGGTFYVRNLRVFNGNAGR